jgi:tetratricopeptide (TPR) repeat protein
VSYDVELEIGPADGASGYEVIVVRSPAGEATGSLRLDVAGLLARRRELQATVLASAVTARSLTTMELSLREVGQALFAALFTGPVYGRYTASVAAAAERGEPLRVVLRLHTSELAALPWETLYDPEAGAYLCQREALVRHVQVAAPAVPLRVDPPLRILGLIAAPRDLPRLDVDGERQRLADALAEPIASGQVELVWSTGGTWTDLQSMLLDGPWHVVHFIGHGGYDTPQGEGVLALVGSGGNADLVGAERFTRLLHTARPMPQLIVLNSCSTGEAAADDLFSSSGAALVHSGVSAVVAMQFAVSDPAAIAFARGLYAAIAHNRNLGEAVRIGRIAIEGTGPHTLEWVTPVLYLRGEDTALFTVIEPGTVKPVEPPKDQSPERAAEEAALYSLYSQAQAELRLQRSDMAATLLGSLLARDSDYRDAAEQQQTAQHLLRLSTAYRAGRAAEKAGDWAAATREYASIIRVDPDYQDAATRLTNVRERQRIADLQPPKPPPQRPPTDHAPPRPGSRVLPGPRRPELAWWRRRIVWAVLIVLAVVVGTTVAVVTGERSARQAELVDLSPVGDAVRLGDKLRLTAPEIGQRGAAWSTERRNVQQPFSATFQFQITDPDAQGGADGLAFVIQNYGRSSLGDNGGGIGYHGIPNSVAVEFDTSRTPRGTPPMTVRGDPNDHHIGVHTAGNGPNSADEELRIGTIYDDANPKDGRPHTARVRYSPGRMDIYLDDLDTPALTVRLNLATTLRLTNGEAWIGLTAATGNRVEQHEVWSLNWQPA